MEDRVILGQVGSRVSRLRIKSALALLVTTQHHCHAPVLNGSVHLQHINFKSPILLNLSINNSLQGHELQKEQNILYNTRVWPVHHELLLLARSRPLQGKDFVLLLSSGKGWRKKG
jgi:hypothetical protein